MPYTIHNVIGQWDVGWWHSGSGTGSAADAFGSRTSRIP